MPSNNDVKYLAIRDFSPGIRADYRINTGISLQPAVMPSTKPGEAAFKQTFSIPSDQGGGSADFYTRGYYANDQKNLVPLPYLRGSNPFLMPAFGTDTFQDVAGFVVTPAFVGGYTDDFWVWEHVLVAGAPAHDAMKVFRSGTLIKTHTGALTAIGPSRGVTHVLSRGKRTGFATPGGPELFWEWTSGEPHTDGSVMFYDVFPDPSNVALDGTFEETGTINNAALLLGGQILGHDGRILRLCEQNHAFGTHSFFSNERVRNTDPPNSVSLAATTTDSIVDPQTPNIFGAWGSLTYGELLLIKQYGGALLVEGDIYAPQITRLPGVQSTGTQMSETASCAAGLVYMTDDGPYLWQGGSSSQRLGYPAGAIQLITADGPAAGGSGITCSVVVYNNLVIFSGGAVWDSIHGNWWTLQLPYLNIPLPYFGVSTSAQGTLWGIINGIGTSGRIEIYGWTPNQLATAQSQGSWLSQPLVTAYDTVDITACEISLGAIPSDFTNVTVGVYFATIDGQMRFCGNFSPNPSHLDGTWRFRCTVGVRARNIQPYLLITNTQGNLPIVTEITVSYHEAGRFGKGNQTS